jgi:putative nucleotidyltransferase with HDIG domain
MSALDARDRETEGHSWRVGQVACRLGQVMGLDPKQIKTLERGALLHDIGKIGVSDSILHKPGPLNPDEWELMRKHPDIGARIAREVPFLGDAVQVIQYHHERWNGSGYPAQLSGTNIPILARIFAIADAFDALTSQRPYRESLPTEVAIEHLRTQAGILFDASIVDIFERLIVSGELADVIFATEIPTKPSKKTHPQ